MAARSLDGIARPARPALREAGIVAIYTMLFLVLLPAVLWVLGGRLDALLRLPPVTFRALRVLGVVMAVDGTWRMAEAMLRLRTEGRGWPISHLAPALLVGLGPYLRTRHPVYLGFVAAFVGAGLASGSWGRALGAGLVLTVATLIYALGFEEPRLVRRFGRAYVRYRASTPILVVPFGRLVKAAAERAWLALRPAAQRLANWTVLAQVGPSLWVSYGLFAALGAGVVAAGVAAALAALGVAASDIDVTIVGVAAAVACGSRLTWLAGRWPQMRRAPIATLRQVGFVSWGGYLAFFGSLLLAARVFDVPPYALLDRALVLALAGHGISRLGCLSYGCCYGRESSLGVRWRHPDAKVCRELGVEAARPRVPTQLLSAAHSLGVGLLALVTLRRGTPPGTVTGVVLVGYALGRGAIECLRADRRRTPWQLTAGQIGAAAALAIGVLLLLSVPVPPAGVPGRPALDLGRAAAHAPALLAAMLLVWLAYGFHWKRVGAW